MGKKVSKAMWGMLVAAVVCVGLVPRANAVLQIDVNGTLLATDQGAGDLTPGTVGLLTASFTTSVFTVLVEVGQSKPVLAGGAMTLSTTYTASGTAGSAVIRITDTGFTAPATSLFASEGGNLGTGVTQQWSAFANSSNTAFCGAGVAVNLGTVSGTTGASGSTSGSVTSPYCLTGTLTLTSAGGNAGIGGSADDRLNTVPEPSAMLLFGIGLVGLGVYGRKRLSK